MSRGKRIKWEKIFADDSSDEELKNLKPHKEFETLNTKRLSDPTNEDSSETT